MNDYTIQTSGLTKYYGKNLGVKNLSLSVKKGEIFGFLGPNGAGKTTTIRLLLGLIKPSSGSIKIFNKDCSKNLKEILGKIGYLPGDIGLYNDMSGEDYLNYLLGLSVGNTNDNKLANLKEKFAIDFKKKIKHYSKGMKQIIGIIQAFMHDPQLLILDEPTSGLDPIMQEIFYEMLLQEKDNGKTIFLSSHILSEVKRICDRIGIIRKGKLIDTEELKKYTSLSGKKVMVVPYDKPQMIYRDLKQLKGINNLKIQKDRIEFFFTGDINELIDHVKNIKIKEFNCETPDIEDIFLGFYRK
jgi:ABC-2 type transport system ATP-binding protein